MNADFRIDRRAVIKGIAGASLALPVLDVMGSEIAEQTPKRFCAVYTANGMSLPKKENGIDEWSWFPRSKEEDRPQAKNKSQREIVFGESTNPLDPFKKQVSFLGGLHHENGLKADPHVCSDMWLTGAPLHNPKPGTYNTVSLDQVVAPAYQAALSPAFLGVVH